MYLTTFILNLECLAFIITEISVLIQTEGKVNSAEQHHKHIVWTATPTTIYSKLFPIVKELTKPAQCRNIQLSKWAWPYLKANFNILQKKAMLSSSLVCLAFMINEIFVFIQTNNKIILLQFLRWSRICI